MKTIQLSQKEITVNDVTLKTVCAATTDLSLKLPLHRNVQTVAEDESKDPSRTVPFFLIQPAAGDSQNVIKQGKNVVSGERGGGSHRDCSFPAPERPAAFVFYSF